MAGSRTSFTKRQKEQSRLEKRREKEDRKRMRALEKQQTPDDGLTGSNQDAILVEDTAGKQENDATEL